MNALGEWVVFGSVAGFVPEFCRPMRKGCLIQVSASCLVSFY